MNLNQIIDQLNDLPSNFKRPGSTYQDLTDSYAVGLAYFSQSSEEISVESRQFLSAQYGWLDVWGLLFGIQRNPDEADYLYRNRVYNTLTAWVGTLIAIEKWGDLILGGVITVSEAFPSVGYNIFIAGQISLTSVKYFLQSLSRIRPAGMPFTLTLESAGGLFLDAVNYFDCPRVTGSYFSDSTVDVDLEISSSTNNSVPLLPSYYLSDPTLNPSLA